MDERLQGTTMLVTGATSGIGYATAEGLGRLGAHVILAVRDPERGEQARRALTEAVGADRFEIVEGDLASLASVRSMAAEVVGRHPRLDVLINNAGLAERRRRLSADGIELTLAVNLVAPFLLTALLLGLLRTSAPSRVVNVSSESHRDARIDLDDLQFVRRRYGMLRAYGQSKLGLNLFTVELARRLAGTGVTANALHPGVVATSIVDDNPLMRLGSRLVRPFMLSPRDGARTTIHLASSPDAAGVSGAYFIRSRGARQDPAADDPDLAARLWSALETLAGARTSGTAPG